MEKKKRKFYLISGGIVSGLYCGYAAVRPYNDTITLSELVLQLTGSRGEYALDTSVYSLLRVVSLLIPYFIYLFFTGIDIYKHFCVAGIYVFSRMGDWAGWYIGEVKNMMRHLLVFHGFLLTSVLAYSSISFTVVWNSEGWKTIISHFFLIYLRFLGLLLLTNLLSLILGSGTGLAIVLSISLGELAILPIMERLNIQGWNPEAYLILGWETEYHLHSGIGVLLYIIELGMIIFLGIRYINRYDFLVNNMETR